MALLFVVGTVVQIITLTGVKGLLVLGALELGDISRLIIYVVMGISLPLMGGVLTHLGGAVILGIPFTLALLDQNIVAVVAAASMLGVLSQGIPPSALGGYFAQELVGIPRYSSMLRLCVIPLLVSILFSMVVLYFANGFAALLVPGDGLKKKPSVRPGYQGEKVLFRRASFGGRKILSVSWASPV